MKFNAKNCLLYSTKFKSSFFYIRQTPKSSQKSRKTHITHHISYDLKWKTHITCTAKWNNSTQGFLRRNLRHAHQSWQKNAYLALIRSTLEYGGIVLDPYQLGDINRLERVQRSAALFIARNYKSRQDGYVAAMLTDLAQYRRDDATRGWCSCTR